LNDRYLYLLINLASVAIPLLASFYPKAAFYKEWKHVFIAIVLPAIPFLIWDEIFTQSGFWGFNEQYITGIMLGSLPLEEVLFFICIPYACLFTYFVVRHQIQNANYIPNQELISFALIILLLITGLLFLEKAYTGITFLGLSFYLAFLTLKLQVRYLGYFYTMFLIILVPFFFVDSVLTGSLIEDEIVWYNDTATVGLRLGTIPVEDVFYAMLLLLMNVSVFEWLQSRRKRKNP
jgi:lycopene cyclase domain-containing protein